LLLIAFIALLDAVCEVSHLVPNVSVGNGACCCPLPNALQFSDKQTTFQSYVSSEEELRTFFFVSYNISPNTESWKHF
jgi:hypothetical protein